MLFSDLFLAILLISTFILMFSLPLYGIYIGMKLDICNNYYNATKRVVYQLIKEGYKPETVRQIIDIYNKD